MQARGRKRLFKLDQTNLFSFIVPTTINSTYSEQLLHLVYFLTHFVIAANNGQRPEGTDVPLSSIYGSR